MKPAAALAFLLILAACASGPTPMSKPPDDAPVWNLNEGVHPGHQRSDPGPRSAAVMNDMIEQTTWTASELDDDARAAFFKAALERRENVERDAKALRRIGLLGMVRRCRGRDPRHGRGTDSLHQDACSGSRPATSSSTARRAGSASR